MVRMVWRFVFGLNSHIRRCITISTTKPKFLQGVEVDASYYEEPNPYINSSPCNVDLLRLSRYAKDRGKQLIDLTLEEVEQFRI